MSSLLLSSGKVPQRKPCYQSGRFNTLIDSGQGEDPYAPKAVVRRSNSVGPESIVRPSYPVQELPDPLPGTLKMMDTIDVGAYGEVWKGTWASPDDLKVLVAVKTIRISRECDPERLHRRFQREVQVWKALEHPNIVPFTGYQLGNGNAALVSPWYENGNLKDYLRQRPNAEDPLKLRLICDAARGLQYLHSRAPPIVHGDIKPENILVSDWSTGQVCDFGLARVVDILGDGGGLTTSGLGLGPVAYQSKELLLGISPSTVMSDVYAFGGLTLAAMTGKAPFFRKKTAAAIILAICRDETAIPVDHPELRANDSLWDFCMRCWSPDPQSRPSVAQIISELQSETQQRSPSH